MVNKMQVVVLVLLTVYLYLIQAAQFSFNKAEVAISEGGDLPSQISILKSGEINGTISFRVSVISGTATENEDYISNSAIPYVFTNDTREIAIRTQLATNRAGESIENFMICLPDAQVLRSMGAEPVQPTCVTITIVDDDSVVIGFKNSLEAVVEGGTKSVCAEVKPEGLRLDPFDSVSLTVRINPVSSEVQLNTNSIAFEEGMVGEQCVIVTVTDSDNTNMGNRSYNLSLEVRGTSSVPVEIYPNTVSILVIDDDTPETDTSFRIISPQSIITVLEGSRIEGIQVLRLRDTAFTYNITIVVTGTAGSDVVITSSLIFDPFTSEKDVEVEIMDNTMSEQRRQFTISIDGTMVVGAPLANFATAVGGPVTILVYDNDFEIGFTEGEFSALEGASNIDICVEIIKPAASSDIEPSLSIPITIALENSASSVADFNLDRKNILLNATNKMVCVALSLNAVNSSMRSYFVQLTWTDDQAGYDVYFPSSRQNATVTITDDSQGSGQKQLSSGAVAGIVIAVLLILIGGIIISMIVVIIILLRVHPNGKQDVELREQQGQKQHKEENQGQTQDQKQDLGQKQDEQDPGQEQILKQKQKLEFEEEANPPTDTSTAHCQVYEIPDPIQLQPQPSPSHKTADDGNQKMTTSTHIDCKSDIHENNSNGSSSADP